MLGTTFRFVARQKAVPFRAISSLSSNPSIVSLYKCRQTRVADHVQESCEKLQDTIYKLSELP